MIIYLTYFLEGEQVEKIASSIFEDKLKLNPEGEPE